MRQDHLDHASAAGLGGWDHDRWAVREPGWLPDASAFQAVARPELPVRALFSIAATGQQGPPLAGPPAAPQVVRRTLASAAGARDAEERRAVPEDAWFWTESRYSEELPAFWARPDEEPAEPECRAQPVLEFELPPASIQALRQAATVAGGLRALDRDDKWVHSGPEWRAGPVRLALPAGRLGLQKARRGKVPQEMPPAPPEQPDGPVLAAWEPDALESLVVVVEVVAAELARAPAVPYELRHRPAADATEMKRGALGLLRAVQPRQGVPRRQPPVHKRRELPRCGP